MQGIYYLLSIVAVLIVFVWYIRNDGPAESEPTRGLLAMKEPTAPKPLDQLTSRNTKGRWSSKSTVSAKANRNPKQNHMRSAPLERQTREK